MRSVLIVGTGLIGASIGLALRRAGFTGAIGGIDNDGAELAEALKVGAIDRVIDAATLAEAELRTFDVVVLCVPVLGILDWMGRLRPMLGAHQLLTDVGSTKVEIVKLAAQLYPSRDQVPQFLPGHPMAGKEAGGAALAEAGLFAGAMWLFTPGGELQGSLADAWREWVGRFGCRTMEMDAARHDQVCAWVSHLPQMVSTAMSALFAEEFAAEPELQAEFRAIGGRALREMTRLGASPYSMWRDVAMTNTQPLAATLFALEQRLAHMREGLRTPELREEFRLANAFRATDR